MAKRAGRGNFSASVIDTSPGRSNPFSPSAGWSGSEHDYWELIRERYRLNREAQQRIDLIARNYRNPRCKPVMISGPFRDAAIEILERIRKA